MSRQSWFGRKGAELAVVDDERWCIGGRLEREMDAELEFHLEAVTADLMRAGHSPAEAARKARIALGTSINAQGRNARIAGTALGG